MIGPLTSFSGNNGRELMPPGRDGRDGAPAALSAKPSPASADGDGRGDRNRRTKPGKPESIGELCRLMGLLADKTRLRILRILADGERPVLELTAELKLPQPTVSHHLAWLRMMDLVSPRRQGKHVFYGLGTATHYASDGSLTFTVSDATVKVTPRD